MPDAVLPTLLDRAAILKRLDAIFPAGTPSRQFCVREMAASTVFAMLYIGAIEGTGRRLAPRHVYRMTEEQSARITAEDRLGYGSSFRASGNRWYADNTREPIRDETLREGLVTVGAVIAASDIPTTSARPRYALEAGFAKLFDPSLTGEAFRVAVAAWQQAHLSAGALARVGVLARGLGVDSDGVLVRFPNGETRKLAVGPSSVIAKAVVEEFAPRFLDRPGVVLLSESREKIVARDEVLVALLRLELETDRNLPDVLLVDLGPREPLIVFVEIVATDGAITPSRQEALLSLATRAGYQPEQVAFVTAYLDRGEAAFRRTVSTLAWHAFVWFVSEPDSLLILRGRKLEAGRLHRLL